MGASDEWTEWHLTPRGWESGSEKVDGAGRTAKDDPEGSVLVYRYRECQSSIYGKQDVTVDRMRGDETAQNVVALLEKFGPCPRSL